MRLKVEMNNVDFWSVVESIAKVELLNIKLSTLYCQQNVQNHNKSISKLVSLLEPKALDVVHQKITYLERAARNGIEAQKNFQGDIEKEKMISIEQCEATLTDCALFRSWLNEYFGSSESPAVLSNHSFGQ